MGISELELLELGPFKGLYRGLCPIGQFCSDEWFAVFWEFP